MSTDEIRAFYGEEMGEDWGSPEFEANRQFMNQDVQERLAHDATGVNDTRTEIKNAGLAIGGAVGAGAMLYGGAAAFPRTAWFLGMTQAKTEGEAAFRGDVLTVPRRILVPRCGRHGRRSG